MNKPILLDLFCGAGGAARGYHDAGFDVVGVDINPQPRYPYTFIQADALEYLETVDLDQFAAIHASPVCKRYSFASQFHGKQENHPDFIPPVRKRLLLSGKPYVIENVAGAPLEKAIMLCGTMFGLHSIRHRYFETNFLIFQPYHDTHFCRSRKVAKPGAIAKEDEYWCIGGHFGQKHRAQREALGIDWMETQEEIAQAIPHAYTRYIGQFLMQYVTAEAIA